MKCLGYSGPIRLQAPVSYASVNGGCSRAQCSIPDQVVDLAAFQRQVVYCRDHLCRGLDCDRAKDIDDDSRDAYGGGGYSPACAPVTAWYITHGKLHEIGTWKCHSHAVWLTYIQHIYSVYDSGTVNMGELARWVLKGTLIILTDDTNSPTEVVFCPSLDNGFCGGIGSVSFLN